MKACPLYHVTTPEILPLILEGGFKDHPSRKGIPGLIVTHQFEPGVWLADVPPITVISVPSSRVPSSPGFLAANAELQADHQRYGSAIALERFMVFLEGPHWRHDLERHLPGALAQVERDAATFFLTDSPALVAWRFGAADAARITQPVLYVGGTESGPWFAEMRERLLEWLPQADDLVVEGADHSLVLTHVEEIAPAVSSFLHRHPVRG